MTRVKKFASARDVRVTRTPSHSRGTHKIQFNRDDQLAVIRTLQRSVLKSTVFRKIYYADSFPIVILSRCVCAGVSMWVTFCENVYCRIAKILKIKISDIESKDFQNPDEWRKAVFLHWAFAMYRHHSNGCPQQIFHNSHRPAVELLLLSVLMLMDSIQLKSTFENISLHNENTVRKLLQSSKSWVIIKRRIVTQLILW